MKITLQLDLSKIDRSYIRDNEFTTKGGEVVKQKLYTVEVVPLKQEKFIKEGVGKSGNKWQMVKTHFVAEKRDKDAEANYIGDGVQFRYPEDDFDGVDTQPVNDNINSDDIPF